MQKPIFTTNVSLLWIFNNARILFIRTWRFIAELFNFNFKTIVTMNDERNWYLYIIQRVYLMRSLYFTQIFNEAINDWVCFFFSFLLYKTSHHLQKPFQLNILKFCAKILPSCVLLYNYLQVFFHSLHLQTTPIDRYKIGPFQHC